MDVIESIGMQYAHTCPCVHTYTSTHTHVHTHTTHHTHTHTPQCGNMAREGLRTLVVGKRVLTEEQYTGFEVRRDGARPSCRKRDGSHLEKGVGLGPRAGRGMGDT